MTSSPTPSALDTARQLMAREIGDTELPGVAARAMQQLCTRITDNLRRSVGDDGYNALLLRIFAPTAAEHPVLSDIRRPNDGGFVLGDIATAVGLHGLPVVRAALESLVARLIDVLGSLLGPDMALSLLDLNGPPSFPHSDRQSP